MKTGLKVAIGIGSLALVGGLTYYFVFRKSTTGLGETVGGKSLDEFSERFYDNDWIDGFTNTGADKGIAYLVPSPTKFKIGDKIKVVQDAGATIPEYSGTFTVGIVSRNKKTINGVSYDSIGTDAKYLGNTPKNGGLITLIK
jgi:hypothetical protein